MTRSQLCVVCLDRQICDQFLFSGGKNDFSESFLLEEHLRTIFLLRQLLQFPTKECEALMIEEEVAGRSGNPGAWCSLCEACVEVVRQAFDLHREIAKAVKQVQRLVEGLKDKMKRSWDQEEMEAGGDTLMTSVGHLKIRKYFREKERECQAAGDEDVKVFSAEVEIEEEENNGALQVSPDPLQSLRDLVEMCEVAMNSGFSPPSNGELPGENLTKSRGSRNTWEMEMKFEEVEEEENDIGDPGLEDTHDEDYQPVESEDTPGDKDYQPVESDSSGSVSPPMQGSSLVGGRRRNEKRKRKTYVEDEESEISEEEGSRKLSFSRRPPRRKQPRRRPTSPKKVNTRNGRRRIYQNGPLNCERCSFATEDRTEMYNHRKNHFVHDNFEAIASNNEVDNEDDPAVKCKICSESVPSKRKFLHLKEKHLEVISDKVHLCHLCNQIFASAVNLRTHIRVVHENKRLQCDQCEAQFSSKTVFLDHLERHKQGGKNPFMCEYCGIEYRSRDSLRHHKKKIHNFGKKTKVGGEAEAEKKRQRKCKHCDLVLAQDYELKLHIKEAHAELYQHKCDECDAMYLYPGGLVTHKQAQHSKEGVKCPHCDAEVKCRAYLAGHIRNWCKQKPQAFVGLPIFPTEAGEVPMNKD